MGRMAVGEKAKVWSRPRCLWHRSSVGESTASDQFRTLRAFCHQPWRHDSQ